MLSQPAHQSTRHSEHEPYWPAQLAVLGAILLYVTLPARLTVGPTWLVPACESALLLALVVTTPHRHAQESGLRRTAAIILVALVNAANVASLVLLVHYLLRGGKAQGQDLVFSSIQIWLTNVLIFGLWYWELDRGGPGQRRVESNPRVDWQFPQMVSDRGSQTAWKPNFVDYLYLSFTNATAFSPTDAMPLTPRAKILMMVQALASLLTVVLVAARAVNILS